MLESEPNPNPGLDYDVPSEIDSDEGQLNPFPWYEEMRDNNPVRYDEDRKRWDVFRYDTVERVFMDKETFVSAPASDFDPLGAFDAKVFGDTDPPDHTRQRGQVDDFFRPGKMRDFRPQVRERVDELLDEALEDGDTLEVSSELSKPTTIWAISEIMGVPTEHMDQLTELFSRTLDQKRRENSEPMEIEVDGTTYGPGKYDVIKEYFTDYLLEERAKNPKNDVVSQIAQAGEVLSPEEQFAMTIFLYGAGFETSARAIDMALWTFAEEGIYPELRDGDIDHRSAFEESLRYRTALMSMAGRTTAEEVELHGTTIPEGEQICMWVQSANRDPRKFDDADEFKPERSPNPHLSFGKGIHYCLGAPLALFEGDVVLNAITDRVEEIEITQEELKPHHDVRIYGLEELNMRFTT